MQVNHEDVIAQAGDKIDSSHQSQLPDQLSAHELDTIVGGQGSYTRIPTVSMA